MRRFNVLAPEFTYDDGRPPGYRTGIARIGPAIGADRISASVYELPPGESTWPYHFEHGAEEWLHVLEGNPTLRHPGGEDELEPGDVVCFPDGPEGAHKLTNRSDETARADDPLDHRPPGRRRLPRQRQGRRLAGRRRADHGAARARRATGTASA